MSNDGHSKIKILFVIHDLSVGGAEKVLINLVNNMDYLKLNKIAAQWPAKAVA